MKLSSPVQNYKRSVQYVCSMKKVTDSMQYAILACTLITNWQRLAQDTEQLG